MSPTKFENQIKEKLENRRIEPSEGSWNKLVDSLEKKNKFPVKKLMIAASFIGFITTIIFTFNNGDNLIKNTKVITKDSVIVEPFETDKTLTTTTIINPKKEISDKKIIVPTTKNIAKKVNKPVVKKKLTIENDKQIVTAEIQKKPIIENSLNKVVLKNKIDKNTISLDQEVAILLSNANIKISANNLKDSSKIASHNSLLEEAEFELEIDKTFKNKIYKTIVSNYNTISKSVSNKKNNN